MSTSPYEAVGPNRNGHRFTGAIFKYILFYLFTGYSRCFNCQSIVAGSDNWFAPDKFGKRAG